MSKVYFKYGPMAAGKSTLLLQAANNYTQRGISIKLFTSALDTRSGSGVISSRIGIQQDAEIIENSTEGLQKIRDLIEQCKNNEILLHAVLVDECQFLSKEAVDLLSDLADTCGVKVLCYGIRTDFQGDLFTGSQRLFEIADSIEELKHICSCGEKAVMNARLSDSTEKVLIGAEEAYDSMCRKCYKKHIAAKANKGNV